MDKNKIRIAINGFGRIGRAFFKVTQKYPDFEIVAINDLGDPENLVYLLRYDTVYGRTNSDISLGHAGHKPVLKIGKKHVLLLSQKDPALLPWKNLDIDIVVEATGVFASYEKSQVHLSAGAKRVVVTAPIKDKPIGINGATVLVGVNEKELKTCDISSNASCTTNAGSPLVAILNEVIGIEKAVLNTVHGYTASQAIVDGPAKKDFRRGRAAAQNIVPSSTGAAIATTKAIKSLEGNFDGIAVRVPVPVGSLVDVTFIAKRNTSAKEVNDILTKAGKQERWKKIFSVTDEPIVSSDIIGNPHASIADLSFTRVVGGNLVKVLAWYDNEMGYVNALAEHVLISGRYIKTGSRL
ncbi:MAG: type I glyceraldehyde-3-phosphate dehydrogenase [Parcubacteria group bacterium]|nr:type I glyceraldehyde-3-phosphate dehydrogenase [Parcubacteria group bacterium]